MLQALWGSPAASLTQCRGEAGATNLGTQHWSQPHGTRRDPIFAIGSEPGGAQLSVLGLRHRWGWGHGWGGGSAVWGCRMITRCPSAPQAVPRVGDPSTGTDLSSYGSRGRVALRGGGAMRCCPCTALEAAGSLRCGMGQAAARGHGAQWAPCQCCHILMLSPPRGPRCLLPPQGRAKRGLAPGGDIQHNPHVAHCGLPAL